MECKDERFFEELLIETLIPALGCTEPIAIAFAAAKCRETLGVMPDKVLAEVSGNIVKNVKSVVVPNTNGSKGIDTAVAIGLIAGNSEKKLEVLDSVTSDQLEKMQEILDKGIIEVGLSNNEIPLDIRLEMFKGSESAKIRIADSHVNIVYLEKNGEALIGEEFRLSDDTKQDADKLSFSNILNYVRNCNLDNVAGILKQQITYNTAIAKEGIQNDWGANIGSTLLEKDQSTRSAAIALAAAGSDARMSGCEMAVVINSGSGNQGLTVSLPVIEYAMANQVDEETLYRALLLSNLLAIYQKKKIGSLSAYCGVVSAGCASAAAIMFMLGGTDQQVADTLSSGLGIASGIICDGAKESCAAKIATGISAGLIAMEMIQKNHRFKGGDGIVCDDIEDTMNNIGVLGKDAMRKTDQEVLKMMLKNQKMQGR